MLPFQECSCSLVFACVVEKSGAMAAEGEELDINTEVDESMAKEGEGATETGSRRGMLASSSCIIFWYLLFHRS